MATANTHVTNPRRSSRPPNIPGAFNSLNGPKIGPNGFRCLPFDRREPVRQMNGHRGRPPRQQHRRVHECQQANIMRVRGRTNTREAADLPGCPPGNRQVEKPTKRRAADPSRIAFDEAELLQASKDRRQRDVGNHRAGGPGSGTEMWTSAKSDALAGIPANVELFRALKMLFIAVTGPEHQKYPPLRLALT